MNFNENNNFEFGNKSDDNIGVTKNEFNNQFMPYFLDRMMNIDNKMNKTNDLINKNDELNQSNFLTMDKMKTYLSKSLIDEMPIIKMNSTIDGINQEISKLNELVSNVDLSLDREEIEAIIRDEISKLVSKTFVNRQMLKSNVFIQEYNPINVNEENLRNGCVMEYYNIGKNLNFKNRFGSNILFANDNKVGINFNIKNDKMIRNNNIGFKLLGYLKIPTEGIYGIKLNIIGNFSLEIHDSNGNPNTVKKGKSLSISKAFEENRIYMKEGLYPFRLSLVFKNKGKAQLLWRTPDNDDYELIPKDFFLIHTDNVPIKIPIELKSRDMNLVKKLRISGENMFLHFEEIDVVNKNGQNVSLNSEGGRVNVSSVFRSLDETSTNNLINGIKGNHSWNISKQIFRGNLLSNNEREFNEVVRSLPLPFYIYRHTVSNSKDEILVYKRLTPLEKLIETFEEEEQNNCPACPNLKDILMKENMNDEEYQNYLNDIVGNLSDETKNSLLDELKNELPSIIPNESINSITRKKEINLHRLLFNELKVNEDENKMSTDFKLYSNLEDAINNENELEEIPLSDTHNWYYILDGDENKNEGNVCCNHTNRSNNEFIELEFRRPTKLEKITIYNRPDGFQNRCEGAKLELFNEEDIKLNNTNYLNGDQVMHFTL